ncbi:hypothetical protein AGABI2DRAFT_134046 [Agaricus bisporus var. bisporus H97]|uniref:hypothetical protein n=1 Tax=Agaricus bisporus var. bisporus (strain H97 / ATCC MYA-4626 / FGSC 10389) TaxID=936046 RepID=UPI00029F6BB5|nr:hypothetical protein AGABI2DRAFT_134046 [Agaricus bisporus var. bisporus H97]EKV50208.1 hypothetical protein AGABI2DRAFT_134046 [Agaricus bisporus var. bisporus H97]
MYGRNQPQRNTSYAGHQHGYQQQPHARHHTIHYGAQRPLQPPAGADPQLWNWFSTVDVDRSGSISVQELQSALLNGNWTRFDLDTVKMLMAIFDTDRSGTIDFSEFARLWKYIAEWQNVFRHFDRDRSGSIEGHELAEALRSFNYTLAPSLLTLIEYKYASAPTSGYGPPPGITFDRFVRACVVVKTLTEAFQRYDSDRDGLIQINYDQFMSIVLTTP